MKTLEVACANIASVLAAEKGGADRIELCAALGAGGVTPSEGFIVNALHSTRLPVFVMVRPREGDFLYSDEEVEIMLCDILRCKELNVPGVVIGALDKAGNVNEEQCKRFMAAAGDMKVTFHRAFDLSYDAFKAMETIVRLGFHRVLTSGQQPAAPSGKELIRNLQSEFGSSIAIMAGAGVRSENVKSLVEYTGVSEVHLSGKAVYPGAMLFKRQGLNMGAPGSDEYAFEITAHEQIRAVRNALDNQ